MSKTSIFYNVKPKDGFEYSADFAYCLACSWSIEQFVLNNHLTFDKFLSHYNIPQNAIKKTKAGYIFSMPKEKVIDFAPKYNYGKALLDKLVKLPTNDILSQFKEAFHTPKSSPLDLCVYLDALYIKLSNKETKVPEHLFKYIFLPNLIDKSELKRLSVLFEERYKCLPLNLFFNNSTLSDILYLLDINTFNDVLKLNIDTLRSLFLTESSEFLNSLELFNIDCFKKFEECADLLINDLKNDDKLYTVFVKRFVYDAEGKGYTLKQIGEELDLTRERVRQIESKIINKIKTHYLFINRIINVILTFSLSDRLYISKKNLSSNFSDNIYINYFEVLLKVFEHNIFVYSDPYDCFCREKQVVSIKEEITNIFPIAVKEDEFQKLNETQRNVVLKEYRKKDSIYIKRGINFSAFVLSVFDRIFPNGGKFSGSDYEKLVLALKTEYEIYFDSDWHVIQSYLERYDYCLINKGTYINRKYVPDLPDELCRKIEKFILKQKSLVYYRLIFKEFYSDFVKLGVNNEYYAKGLLDKKLSSAIKCGRSYCCKKSINASVFALIEEYCKQNHGVISSDKFLKSNPGFSVISLYNYFSYSDSAIWLSGKRFCDMSYFEKQISKTKVLFKKEILDLFESLDVEMILHSKLYSKIKISSPHLLSEFNFIENPNDLFSVLRYLLKDDFYFQKSYISKSSDTLLGLNAVKKYFSTQSRVSLKEIQNYCDKMHIRIYDNLKLIIEFSDCFVQCSINEGISINTFDLSKDDLLEIINKLNFYINSYGFIKLENFNGYSSLPIIKYPWNKYLLVGIVRTYLSDLYDIEYTDKAYNTTDFIIRRKEK